MLENSKKFGPKSQAEALATELPTKKCALYNRVQIMLVVFGNFHIQCSKRLKINLHVLSIVLLKKGKITRE